jgi:hypothetical protein
MYLGRTDDLPDEVGGELEPAEQAEVLAEAFQNPLGK